MPFSVCFCRFAQHLALHVHRLDSFFCIRFCLGVRQARPLGPLSALFVGVVYSYRSIFQAKDTGGRSLFAFGMVWVKDVV